MIKKLLFVLALCLVSTNAYAAPNVTFFQNLLPEVDSKFDLGSTTPLKAWLHVYADQFCLTADICITAWPTGGGGGSGTVSTSTTETKGFLSYWTSSGGTPALLGQVATTSLTATSPLSLSQPISVIGPSASALSLGTVGYANGGTGSTTAPQGQLLYGGATAYQSVATTSVSCSGSTSCTSFTAIGSSPVTISSVAVGSGLATSTPIANSNVLTYSTTGAGSAYGTATTSLTFTGPFNGLTTLGALVGGTASNVVYWGLSTTSQPASSNILVSNGGAGVYGAATSTPTAGDGITVVGSGATIGTLSILNPFSVATTSTIAISELSYFTKTGGKTTVGGVATGTVSAGSTAITVTAGRAAVGGALAIDCATATGSQTGCISSTDWSTFNAKQGGGFQIATTSTIAISQVAYFTKTGGVTTIGGQGTTSVTAGAGLTGTLTTLGAADAVSLNVANANNWTALQTFVGATTTSLTVSNVGTSTILRGNANIYQTLGIGGTSTTTLSGEATSTFPFGINVFAINQTGTATSTFAKGINIAAGGGCFAINGTCITGGVGGGLASYDAWTHAIAGISATTSSIGIGSTTPFSFLSVSSASAGSAATSLFAVASNTNATMFNVLGNGNVGIGTTTPGTLFSIQGQSNFTTATTTFLGTGGINLKGGCFAINGACLNNGIGGTETPSGTINSSTVAFTTTYNPVAIFLNGAFQTPGGVDYTLSGSGPYTITYVVAPPTGSTHTSQYLSGAAGVGGGLVAYDAFTHPAAGQSATTSLMLLNGQASTTQLSAGKAYFGLTATTTIDGAGNIVIPSGSALTNTGVSDGCGTFASGVLGSTGVACGSGGTGLATTSPTAGSNLLYYSAIGAGSAKGVATTTLTFTGPFNGLSTLGTLVGGSNSNVVYWGLATTSQPASSNILVSNGGAGVYGVATSSETCGTGVSCAAHDVLTGGGAITLASINANTVLANQTGASAAPVGVATSTLTGTSVTIAGTGSLIGGAGLTANLNLASANDWTGLQTFVGATSTSLTVTNPTATSTILRSANLYGVLGVGTTATTTILGTATSTFAFGINTFAINQTGAATSTFAGGINIAAGGGCFSVGGVCLSSAAGLTSYDAWTHAPQGSSATTSAIGIGTTTPWAQLSVSTSTQSAPTTPLFSVASTTNATLFSILGNGLVNIVNQLRIPYGAAPTVSGNGDIAVDSTADQLTYYSSSARQNLSPILTRSFNYATTSWTGTTTIPFDAVIVPYTFKKSFCFTNTGTVNVQIGNYTASTTLFNASTTVGYMTYTANGSQSAGNKVYVSMGTPASSPTTITCTLTYSWNDQ